MRLAVVHNLRPGGARRRLVEQIGHLQGVDVTEVCLATAVPVTGDPVVVALSPRAPRAARALRAPLRYADLATLAGAWRSAGAEVRRIAPDVVFANPCEMLQGPAMLHAAGAPSLYFCDEPRRADYDDDARGTRNPWTAAPYWPLHRVERGLDRRAVRSATAIATNSAYTAAQIRRAYARDCTVLPMGVPEAMRKTCAGSPTHVLTVGSLIAGKGHDLVIAGVASSRARRPVVLVTPRHERAEAARLEGIAAGLGVALQIRVGISDEELTRLYASALATCYLARGEPLGLVSLEAQACGCPVVVSDEGGLPETVRAGRSGFVVARRAEAVGAALDALEDPLLRGRFSAEAKTWGTEHTWARSAHELRGLLEQLVARTR